MSDMSDSIYDITHRHGKEMYIVALEHAVQMLEILDDVEETRKHLKKNIADRKVELAQPNHNRFDEFHRHSCDDCRKAYQDYLQDQKIDDEQ